MCEMNDIATSRRPCRIETDHRKGTNTFRKKGTQGIGDVNWQYNLKSIIMQHHRIWAAKASTVMQHCRKAGGTHKSLANTHL